MTIADSKIIEKATEVVPGELSYSEKLRRLPWAVAASTANSIFNTLVVSGSVFMLFVSELGMSKTQIGFLLSLFPFAQLVSLFILPQVARYGYKRTYLTFYGIRKLVAGFLIFAPWVLAQFGGQAAFLFVSAILLTYAMCRAIAETGMLPWKQEYVPREVQGKFTAISSVSSTLGGLGALTFASYVIGSSTQLQRFQLLTALGVLFGLLMIWFLTHLPGGAPSTATAATSKREFREALRDPPFVIFLWVAILMTLASGPLTSFMPLFMQEQLGLSASQVVRTQTGSMVGMLISSYSWGWAGDRFGSKRVSLLGLALMIGMPLLWMILPRHTPWSALLATGLVFVQGAANMGWAVGSSRLLYADVVPPGKRGSYMAVYYAWSGLAGGLSELFGGRLLDTTAAFSGKFWIFTLDPFTPLIIASALLSLVSLLLIYRIRVEV